MTAKGFQHLIGIFLVSFGVLCLIAAIVFWVCAVWSSNHAMAANFGATGGISFGTGFFSTIIGAFMAFG